MSENVERLVEAGVVLEPIKSEYQDVIDGLEPEEVDALIAVKEKLDAAGAGTTQSSGHSLNLAIII